jgi:hypothetical protein
MEHLWKVSVRDMPEMDKLQGSFYICAFGGGRWPQVVNIMTPLPSTVYGPDDWEDASLDDWLAQVDSTASRVS